MASAGPIRCVGIALDLSLTGLRRPATDNREHRRLLLRMQRYAFLASLLLSREAVAKVRATATPLCGSA